MLRRCVHRQSRSGSSMTRPLRLDSQRGLGLFGSGGAFGSAPARQFPSATVGARLTTSSPARFSDQVVTLQGVADRTSTLTPVKVRLNALRTSLGGFPVSRAHQTQAPTRRRIRVSLPAERRLRMVRSPAVLRPWDQLHVRRVDTPSVVAAVAVEACRVVSVACVVNLYTCGDWPVRMLPREPMRVRAVPASPTRDAIPPWLHVPSPWPTFVGPTAGISQNPG